METTLLEGGGNETAWVLTGEIASDRRDYIAYVNVYFYALEKPNRVHSEWCECAMCDASAVTISLAVETLHKKGVELSRDELNALERNCKVAVIRRTRN